MQISLIILIATLVATSLMTAFSYVVSRLVNKQFREPQLLNILIAQVFNMQSLKHILGWLIHYAIGLTFTIGLVSLWQYTGIDSSWFSALYLGVFLGVLGALGWSVMFKLISFSIHINQIRFYIQLIIAHVIFTLSVLLVYEMSM